MHPMVPIHTERLTIRALATSDAEALWRGSLDEDNRRFVPDEYFETIDDAQETLDFLLEAARGEEGPYVCPMCTESGEYVGYVQLCRVDEGWEIGYHTVKAHTGKGYAAEALKAFLPEAARAVGASKLYGVVLEENAASVRVLEKCGFELEFCGIDEYQGEMRSIRRYISRA